MPLTHPATPPIDRPCQAPECPFGAHVLVTGGHADAGDDTLAVCMDDVPTTLLPWVRQAPAAPGHCVACGRDHAETFTFQDDELDLRLCRGHLLAFLTFSLRPAAWRRLVRDAGATPETVADLFWIGGEFYSPHGIADEPYPLGAESVRAAIAAMPVLPEMPEVPRALVVQLREGYRALTGFTLPIDGAVYMVAHCLEEEAEARRARESSLTTLEEQRTVFAPTIEALLMDADPRGLVAAGATAPYHTAALWFAKTIDGGEYDDPEMLYVRLRTALGWTPDEDIPDAVDDCVSDLADTCYEQVVQPLRRAHGQWSV